MDNRRKWLLVVALVSVMAMVAGGATAVAFQTRDGDKPIETPDIANPELNPVQYSVKFVCGWLPPVPPQDDRWLKPGNYATIINIHNHTTTNVQGGNRVALFYRMGTPPPPLVPPFPFTVTLRRVLAIDCIDIWAMAGLPPGSFIEGAVHIGLSQQLSVSAVYTAQTHPDPLLPADPGAGTSIDVEQYFPIQGGHPG